VAERAQKVHELAVVPAFILVVVNITSPCGIPAATVIAVDVAAKAVAPTPAHVKSFVIAVVTTPSVALLLIKEPYAVIMRSDVADAGVIVTVAAEVVPVVTKRCVVSLRLLPPLTYCASFG
jgi:hypothetical protein